MSDNRDILMLEFLCRLGTKVDALTAEVRDLRHRITRAEHQLAASAAAEAVHHATITVRLDRLEARLDRLDDRPEATDRPDAA
jgi:predicted  nucleic acid-binding Zn-ribbon protein